MDGVRLIFSLSFFLSGCSILSIGKANKSVLSVDRWWCKWTLSNVVTDGVFRGVVLATGFAGLAKS